MIAIGGFIARAQALLGGATEQADLQRPTAIGGLIGLSFAIVLTFFDAILG
jgi:hypothetical protein